MRYTSNEMVHFMCISKICRRAGISFFTVLTDFCSFPNLVIIYYTQILIKIHAKRWLITRIFAQLVQFIHRS